MNSTDERLMRRAIDESRLAAEEDGSMPFGAVLAIEGREVLAARNACASDAGVRGGGGSDATRHAEVELVRKACAELSVDERARSTMYASTEPCVMCAGAIYWASIGTVVYGCRADELEKISGPGGFDIPVESLYAQAKPGSRRMIVRGPILEEEALKVHRECGCWNLASAASLVKEDEVSEIAVERSLLSSGIGGEAVDADAAAHVPVIDMAQSDAEVAEQMWRAANEIGFFSVVNHGMAQDNIDSLFRDAEGFFAQSVGCKKEQSPFDPACNSGFEYFSQVRPSTGTTDQKESLQITARRGCMDGRWPSEPPDFRATAERVIDEAHSMACRIMTLLEAKACPHLNPGTLARSHSLWEEDGQCTLRLLHYPPMTPEDLRALTEPGKVHWRAGPHTDWDNITLLFQRIGQPGLECRANPQRAFPAGWIPVPPLEGGIAVNIGDMLGRWSDGALFSNLHRVRMPDAKECGTSRYSIAFFAQADRSVLLESRESEPITAGNYITSRVRSNYSECV